MRELKLTVILALLTIELLACTCDERINKKRLIKDSDFAFIGVVNENIYINEFEESYRKDRGIRTDAKMKIVKMIKGTTSSNVVVAISSASGECDINFIPGKKYLIIGNFRPREIEAPFDPSLLPPDSLSQVDSTLLDTGTISPNTKTRDQWLTELAEANRLIFTTVCLSFQLNDNE